MRGEGGGGGIGGGDGGERRATVFSLIVRNKLAASEGREKKGGRGLKLRKISRLDVETDYTRVYIT